MAGEVKSRTAGAIVVAIIMIFLMMYLKSLLEKWEPTDWSNRTMKEYTIMVMDGIKALSTAIVLPWILLKTATLQEMAESYVDFFIDAWDAITSIGDIVPDDAIQLGGRRRRH